MSCRSYSEYLYIIKKNCSELNIYKPKFVERISLFIPEINMNSYPNNMDQEVNIKIDINIAAYMMNKLYDIDIKEAIEELKKNDGIMNE